MNQQEKAINAREIYTWCDEKEEENRKLRDRLTYLEAHCIIADKFYNTALSVKTVADMHAVCPATVRNYVTMGAIPKHPDSTDSKILIRGSVALQLDFDELRRNYSVRNAGKYFRQ